jgi:hypothetical protein
MADRVPCPLCEKTSASIGALRHHVKHQHGFTLGEILGKAPYSHPQHRTHCPAGHAYTAENTYFNPSRPGVKHCRECRRQHTQNRRARARLPKLNSTGGMVRNADGKLQYVYLTIDPKRGKGQTNSSDPLIRSKVGS